MFEDIPYLLGEIRSRISPASSPQNGMPTGKGTKKPAPASIGAIDDSDDLYAALVEHAQSIAEELEMKGPPLLHRKSDRGPLGFPAHTTVDAAISMGRNACRFIEYHLPYVGNDLADDVYTDIKRRYAWLSSRYQRNAEAEQLPARCPECLCLSVYKKPPREFGDAEVYHCRTCMNVLTEAEAYRQCEAREKELKSKRGRKKRGSVDLTKTGR